MTTNNNQLSNRAVLITISRGAWTGRKQDKKASSQVVRENDAKSGVARVHKDLIARDALKKYTSISQACYAYVDAHTAPWFDAGSWRIMLTSKAQEIMAKIRDFQRQAEDEAEKFFENYEEYVRQGKIDQGKLADDTDYPPLSEIRHKFYIRASIMPLPEADDFRVNLQGVDMDAIKSAMHDEIQDTIMRDLSQKLHDSLSHVYERLENKDNSFKNTLFKQLIEALSIGELSNNPIITGIIKNCEKLVEIDPDDLRKDMTKRDETAKQAKDMLSKLKGFV